MVSGYAIFARGPLLRYTRTGQGSNSTDQRNERASGRFRSDNGPYRHRLKYVATPRARSCSAVGSTTYFLCAPCSLSSSSKSSSIRTVLRMGGIVASGHLMSRHHNGIEMDYKTACWLSSERSLHPVTLRLHEGSLPGLSRRETNMGSRGDTATSATSMTAEVRAPVAECGVAGASVALAVGGCHRVPPEGPRGPPKKVSGISGVPKTQRTPA